MLRVSSILYLQQVWTRPIPIVLNEQPERIGRHFEAVLEEQHSTISTNENELEPEILKELEQSLLQIQPSRSTSSPILNSQESINNSLSKDIAIAQEVDELSLEKAQKQGGDQHPAIHDMPQQGNASTSDCTSSLHTYHSLSFVPLRSGTPMTNHEEPPMSDEEKPASNKFSPKRLLSRARSSITEESVRNLSRRTSMLLDKITIITPPTSDTALKTLRRHSTKLTTKGKSFTKKLKSAISFQQK